MLHEDIYICNSMVQSAIWKKHARVSFSKTIKTAHVRRTSINLHYPNSISVSYVSWYYFKKKLHGSRFNFSLCCRSSNLGSTFQQFIQQGVNYTCSKIFPFFNKSSNEADLIGNSCTDYQLSQITRNCSSIYRTIQRNQ